MVFQNCSLFSKNTSCSKISASLCEYPSSC